MAMRTTLVTIPTETVPLDGAYSYYEPEDGAATGAALLFHGNTMNFYQGAPRFLPPVLYLRGDQEPAELYPAEALKARSTGACTIEIVANCGHFYVGREEAVAASVATWLARTLPPSPASPG